MVDAPMPPKEPKRAPTRRARKKKATTEVGGGRKKEFTYRGFSVEELVAMPQDEMLSQLPSRARRFFSRQFDRDTEAFWAKVRAAGAGEEMRTHLRDFPITPHFVGKTFMVHNGKDWTKVVVSTDMIGHKLGEFSLTRKPVKHTGPGVGATRSSKFMPLK